MTQTNLEIAASARFFSSLLESQDIPERVDGEIATFNYFGTFAVPPIAGRVFTGNENRPGQAPVVVISERFRRTRLHADPFIVGKPIRVNGLPTTVVGVMPKSFDPLLNKNDLWVPAAFTPAQLADHDDHYLNVMARLKSGVTIAQAQSELELIAHRLQQEYPLDDADRSFHIQPLANALLGDQRLSLRMMVAAVGFLLLIAMRAALGALANRIVRQLLAENMVLGLAGGVVGVFLAYWAVWWISAHGPAEIPRLGESRIDASTLAFACVVAVLSSFLFGLAPAFRSASTRLNEAFKSASGVVGGSRDRVRSLLVVGEVALALMLMTGAGLLVRSALLVSHVDPGFDTSNVIVGRVGLPDAGYHDPAIARQTFERMIIAAGTLPGLESAAVVSRAPLAGGGSTNGLLAEGKPLDLANLVNSQLQIISPSYLSTAHVPLKAGRDFTPQDTRDHTLVTIVNETLARTMWPGENPIGKRFACCESGPKGRMDPVWHEVVGVAADVRAWGLDRPVQPEFYIPLAQMPPSAWDWIARTMDLVVRTRGGVIPIHELQSTVASVARAVPIYQLSTMQQKISNTLERSHFDTFLLAIFAIAALFAFLNRNLRSPFVHGGAAHAGHRYSHGARRVARADRLGRARLRSESGQRRTGCRACRRIGGHPLALLFALRRAPYRRNHVCCRVSHPAGRCVDCQLSARAPRHARRSHGGLALRIECSPQSLIVTYGSSDTAYACGSENPRAPLPVSRTESAGAVHSSWGSGNECFPKNATLTYRQANTCISGEALAVIGTLLTFEKLIA
jgi:putative ABC transport system permease protein